MNLGSISGGVAAHMTFLMVLKLHKSYVYEHGRNKVHFDSVQWHACILDAHLAKQDSFAPASRPLEPSLPRKVQCAEHYMNTYWSYICVAIVFIYLLSSMCVFLSTAVCCSMHACKHASMHTCKQACMYACIFAYVSATLPLWHKCEVSWGGVLYPSAWQLGAKLYSQGPPNAKIRQTDSILWDTFLFTFLHHFLIHF